MEKYDALRPRGGQGGQRRFKEVQGVVGKEEVQIVIACFCLRADLT